MTAGISYDSGQGASSDDAYDDVPPRRSRLGIVVIACVVMLAVVGTAGAFGYRALFGSSGSKPPPVIKADAGPSKIVPPNRSEPSGSKQFNDRVGERSAGEKLVSREEQPMERPQPSAFPVPSVAQQAAGHAAGRADARRRRAEESPYHRDQARRQRRRVGHADTGARHRASAASTPTPAAPPQRVASAPPRCGNGCGRGRAATRAGAVGAVSQRSAIAQSRDALRGPSRSRTALRAAPRNAGSGGAVVGGSMACR